MLGLKRCGGAELWDGIGLKGGKEGGIERSVDMQSTDGSRHSSWKKRLSRFGVRSHLGYEYLKSRIYETNE